LASTPRPLDRVGELRSGLRAPHIAESVRRHGFVAVACRPLSRSPYRAISRSVPTPLRDARADASLSPTLRPFLRRLALPPLVSSPPPRLANRSCSNNLRLAAPLASNPRVSSSGRGRGDRAAHARHSRRHRLRTRRCATPSNRSPPSSPPRMVHPASAPRPLPFTSPPPSRRVLQR
jgi:hypothetical protein